MRYLIIAFLLTGCIHATPRQEAMFYSPEPPMIVTATELRALLPDFAEIPNGSYTLVPRGIMPKAEWQNPFVSDIMMPKHWDCKDFSAWADEKMGEAAAFGTVWDDGHMVNWFVDLDGIVVLFDAQLGQFVTMKPGGMTI